MSEDIDRLSPMAEILFYRLIVKADDYGSYYGNPAIVKSNCFPLKSDEEIPREEVRSWLKELADAFPDLAEHLLRIRDNIVDLLIPFQSGWYYNRAMGGSFSIKSVLPALFPDDPALDYHNLEGVHNGGEAMTIFPKIKDMPPEEQARTRQNLLKYCELDTYAMVKVWEELVRAAK